MHAGSEVTFEGWIATTYPTVWQTFGLNAAYVRGFFSNKPDTTNVFTISTTMLRCYFSAVTFCSQHKKDLMAFAILVSILFMIVAYFGRLFGIPVIRTAFLLIFIPLVIWHVELTRAEPRTRRPGLKLPATAHGRARPQRHFC